MSDELTNEEMMRIITSAPIVFWVCPKGCKGLVTWTQEKPMIATCETCGEKSQPKEPV